MQFPRLIYAISDSKPPCSWLSSGFGHLGVAMLCIEYAHKRIRLFQIERSLVAVACLRIMRMVWQLLVALGTLK